MERQWKLGDDLSRHVNILDPITFDDVILAVHCNERVINREAVQKVMREIMEIRIQDMEYIFNNNYDEIIALAKEGRE